MENKYYTSGRFAKMANVTIRTIRYYDKIGLLKPSVVGDNKYRMYDNNDLIKLQRILFLKQLGFSLEEIYPMVINIDNKDIQYSIHMQMDLIDQQIAHLNEMKKILQDTSQIIQNNEINFDEMIKLVKITSMERDIVQQYKNANNLNVRMSLHDLYSTNPEDWFSWIYHHLDLQDKDVLEVGCGNGKLWQGRQPKAHSIILSDISKGMVNDAKRNLGKDYRYLVCGVEKIPLENQSVDVVIANHMFFYIQDIDQALKEIKRVLKPGGILYCSTYDENHMKEITEMAKEFDSRISLANLSLYNIFGLNNGKNILSPYFKDIQCIRHDDSLLVDDYQPIVDYIISCHGNQNEIIGNRVIEFNHFIERKFTKGKVKITKSAGMFICK